MLRLTGYIVFIGGVLCGYWMNYYGIPNGTALAMGACCGAALLWAVAAIRGVDE